LRFIALPENTKTVPNGTDFAAGVIGLSLAMKKKDLNTEQLSSVPCPTCGVAAGERCVLHSGSPRSEPHLDRKLSAIEAIEKNAR
jgi:hypothetical protein